MNLIDRDTLDDYLGKWADDFYENPENSNADFMDGYCMTLNRIYSSAVPVVDAIPIEFIEWEKQRIIAMPKASEEHNASCNMAIRILDAIKENWHMTSGEEFRRETRKRNDTAD